MTAPDPAKARNERDRQLGLRGACRGDKRFVQPSLPPKVIDELILICDTVCPMKAECLEFALEQSQPVGFIVAAGLRWRSWTFCSICGRKCRGLPLCSDHIGLVHEWIAGHTEQAELE